MRASVRIMLVIALFSIVIITAWEQVDDKLEAKWEDLTTVTYVAADHELETPEIPVTQEIQRKKEIFIDNMDMYWEDTTQKYLQEQLEVINQKMKEIQPMDEQTYEAVKEQIRRVEVSL